MSEEKARITVGSGNVFADLGLPNPEERLLKAQLAYAIWKTIESRGLTQTQAAEVMGVAQPDVSNIIKGRLSGVSVERLLRCLTALGLETTIVVAPERQPEVRVRVADAAHAA